MQALEALEQTAHQPLTYGMMVVLGLLWGSFANVCIYRWPPTDEFPKGRSVVKPPSHCFVCKANVKWYDNVPLLSYLWLRGQCRNCKTKFSPRYLIVEALSGVLFGCAWWAAMNHPAKDFDARLILFVVYASFVFFLLVVTFIDLDHFLILDLVTFPSTPVFYLASLAIGAEWERGLIGAAFGYGIIAAIRWLYFLLRKREGMGLGDAKFLAVVGALFGYQGVLVALFGGSVIGSVIGVAAMVMMRAKSDTSEGATEQPVEEVDDSVAPDGLAMDMGGIALPFGPFLAAATLAYCLTYPYFSINFRF